MQLRGCVCVCVVCVSMHTWECDSLMWFSNTKTTPVQCTDSSAEQNAMHCDCAATALKKFLLNKRMFAHPHLPIVLSISDHLTLQKNDPLQDGRPPLEPSFFNKRFTLSRLKTGSEVLGYLKQWVFPPKSHG